MSLTADQLKKLACDAIDEAAVDLNQVSQDIWTHPEVNYTEEYAHKLLTDFLSSLNFDVERHHVLKTGFRSVYGEQNTKKPNISVLCEYDALPEIGHACGHNLIAEVGVGAAIGIRAALDAAKDAGKDLGTLTVLGTPAEEAGGGKIDMIRAGSFETVDVAMMAHPFSETSIYPGLMIALNKVKVRYTGKAAHASVFPWRGVNALDAAVMAYQNISVMRQQMKAMWRVHGVITDGGKKPSIIPEEASLEYYIRAPTMKELAILHRRVTSCFKAAAEATDCQVEIAWDDKPYANLVSSPTLANMYGTNATGLGVKLTENPYGDVGGGGSTDMGNVSHVVPSLHPHYYIGTKEAIHTRLFRVAAGEPVAQLHTIRQAKSLGMTAIDVYCQPHLVDKMKTELKELLQHQEDDVLL